MGTDIHLYAERKEENGWQLIWPTVPEPSLVRLAEQIPGDTKDILERARQSWYDGRNYTVFSILVRNGMNRVAELFVYIDSGVDRQPPIQFLKGV